MNMIRLALAALIILGLAAQAPAAKKSPQPAAPQQEAAPDPNAQGLYEFFKAETKPSAKSLDFQITGGYADLRTESPESSGRYFMAGSTITAVAPDIYRLDLTFKKKYQRDVIDLVPEYYFTQQKSYYFWYDGGKKLVLKIGNGKKTINFDKKELTSIKVKTLETYTVEKTKLDMNVVFSDGGSQIYLVLKFI
ncbi:MAG: hypothetical protein ACLGQW_03355 [Acidobacteriota bacterium]